MRTVLILQLLALVGCGATPDTPKGLPSSIGRFRDGNITCYVYFQNAISCVKDSLVDELNKEDDGK